MTKMTKKVIKIKTPRRALVSNLVETTGFEPATFCSQSRRDTKLRYVSLMIELGQACIAPA